MIKTQTYVLCAAMLAATAVPAKAAACQDWTATSRTAISITGNIKTCRNSVTFGNGKRLNLEYEGKKNGPWVVGSQLSGAVYRVSPPSDPELLNGNTLCAQKARYIVLSSPPVGGLALSVFSDDLKNFCALYYYDPS